MDTWQAARLIPVSGIAKGAEAEQRATSALLAVLRVVRPFSKSLLSPLGASKADRANVESFIEVTFKNSEGKSVRPDGLIRVTFGRADPWIALVEVKTGKDTLSAEQINSYFDVAAEQRFDAVITISNEIAPAPGVHPTAGLKVRSNSRVKVHHFSWSMILAEAVQEKQHRGVSDPEQAWILGELIRYLEHDSSGALDFDDMGAGWAAVRDGARDGSLSRKSEEVIEIAQLWDQLVRFLALKLGSDIGDDVRQFLPRKELNDPRLRNKNVVDQLCEVGVLSGTLRVPNTAGDIDLVVDLKARQVAVGSEISAPDDRGPKARVTWLTRQLTEAHGQTVIEAYAKNQRSGQYAYLDAVREDPMVLVGDTGREPIKFRIVTRTDMGMSRSSGRKPGFVQSVLHSAEHYYTTVLQNITSYQPKAPQIAKPNATFLDVRDEPAALPDERAIEVAVTPTVQPPTPWNWPS